MRVYTRKHEKNLLRERLQFDKQRGQAIQTAPPERFHHLVLRLFPKRDGRVKCTLAAMSQRHRPFALIPSWGKCHKTLSLENGEVATESSPIQMYFLG